MDYFSIFFKKFKKPSIQFCGFGRKTLFEGNFEKFSKNFKKFLKKIAKNTLF